jgi:hypothetical protein
VNRGQPGRKSVGDLLLIAVAITGVSIVALVIALLGPEPHGLQL